MSEDPPREPRGNLAVPAARVDVVEPGPDGWRRWRALRLAALTEAPQAFGSTLAGALAADDEGWWRARLTTVPHNLVGVLDGTDVAMASLTGPGDDGAPPELISMWVAPAARGAGVADALVRSVVALASGTYPALPVVLSVYADNEPAIRLYARHGFADAGVSPDDPRERRMLRPPS